VKKKYYRNKITEPKNGYLLLDFPRMDTNHELNKMQTDKDCIITNAKIKKYKRITITSKGGGPKHN
jgi:hypothetical protein